MTENGERLGILGAGQRTTQRVDERDERIEAWRHARDNALRRCVEVAWVVVAVPMIAGPWVLVVYVPWAYERAVLAADRWFGFDDIERVDRRSLLALGALTALALALIPDELMGWWPFAWQRSHADWLWLLMHPLWLLLRAVAIVAPLRAWRLEEPHLTNRQRREVEVPAASGGAHALADLHNIEIPGTLNPYRDPEAPPTPEMRGDIIVRYVPKDDDNGSSRAEMVIPLSIIAKKGEHEADTLRRTQSVLGGLSSDPDGAASRAVLQAYGLTSTNARTLQEWLAGRGYAEDRKDGRGYVVTNNGRRWLSIAERHMPPF